MSGRNGSTDPVVVVKLGGSVLPTAKSYRRAARFFRHRLHASARAHAAAGSPSERFVAVVSAQDGSTDALERQARRASSPRSAAGLAGSPGVSQGTGTPSHRALDLLWSIGEIRSVTLLTLHLEALGVCVAGLNVHETGLRLSAASRAAGPETVLFNGQCLLAALATHAVVVVPGFLATDSADTIVSLGRGGSDLTAVLLARSLGAARCELVKDVPGYFSADPRRDSRAQQLPAITFSRALELADAGCDLVQRAAIESAARCGLPLIIRSLDERAPVSVVSHGPACAPPVGKIEFPISCCHPRFAVPARRGGANEGPAFLDS